MSESHDDANLPSTPLDKTSSLDEEPKQPANIPNALEHALHSIDLNSTLSSDTPDRAAAAKFTSNDVKYLFSGAPHFILEKGRHNRWYPHALFPWDIGAVSIQDFWDREPLRHDSFALGTLHAHLPVPGVHARLDSVAGREDEDEEDRPKGAKRSTFDLGIFEVPNMLSINGKERGTVGIRHFLELPVADERRYTPASPKNNGGIDARTLHNMSATQAFETLDHMRDAYAECHPGTVLDRRKLSCQGPEAWKRIGVRDVSVKKLAERLIFLSELRTELLEKHKHITILDRESVATLHEQLYTHILYPTPRHWGHHHGTKLDEENLKSQIEVLARVLAVKGAWVDFSIPESRLRIGQVFWEIPACADSQDAPSPRQTDSERKWLLLQLLLAGELLMRLDAIVRLAVLQPSKNISVSSQDVRELDQLRHGKVNWDVLFAQQFMDNITLKYCSLTISPSPPASPSPQEKTKHGIFALFGRRQSRRSSQSCSESDNAWNCKFTPRHGKRQLKGLDVFAAAIDWPNRDTVMNEIWQNLNEEAYNKPFSNYHQQQQQQDRRQGRCPTDQFILLRQQSSSPGLKSGWLSRTWLTGLVLPGDNINALLMASILENDTRALPVIGYQANLRGGFSYMGASWWSTKCIVGRVLAAADESKVCMGWVKIGRKDLTPRDHASGTELVDTWFSIAVQEAEQKKNWAPRIRQGPKLAIESHPLGKGDVSGSTFAIPVDQQKQHGSQIKIDSFELTVSDCSTEKMVTAQPASISFTLTDELTATSDSLSMPLTYNVHFISSFPCRPPRGSVAYKNHRSLPTESALHHHKSLPGHPLHTSYSYRHITLSSLHPGTPVRTRRSKQDADPVWILDARGSCDREVFARAWCASVGVDAVVGRVGRTCLACCVREARAVDAAVVIRVGS